MEGRVDRVASFQLGSLDPAVEEGGRARRGARVGASRHFFST